MNEKETWFFGYGSLIFDPVYNEHKLEDWCELPIDGEIEEGIEFLHSSCIRGGAPTLCFDKTKRITKGKCWKAVGSLNMQSALDYLKKREGCITKVQVTLVDGKIVPAYCGNTAPDLKGKTTKEIAKLAFESESNIGKHGGITYILKCKEIGITTPMMNDILKEIE